MTDPTMRLVTNSVPPTSVRETDDAYIIEDVPFHKPLDHLDGGYTPSANVEQTASGWHGVPATLYHVRNDQGKPVSANNDPEKHLGPLLNPEWDGEHLRAGEIRIEKSALRALGDRADGIREALENGDPLEVSSQYASTDLPPGEYDGEFRTNAAAIVRPDSVAILPEGSGRCSVEQGCGINPAMAANADVTVPMTDDPVSPEGGPGEDGIHANQELALTDVSPDDVGGYTDAEWDGSDVIASLPNPSESDDAADVLDATHMVHPMGEDARESKANWKLPFRSGPDADVNTRALVAIDAALSGARGGVDGVSGELADAASDRVQAFLDDADADLFGADGEDDMNANSPIEWLVNTAANLWPGSDAQARRGEGPNSPADADDSTNTMDDTDKIEFIVANSDYDRENVAAWEGEDCLDRLYSQVKANADADGGDGTDDSTTDDATDTTVVELTEDELMERFEDRLDALAEEKAEAMVANQREQSEKDDLASTIVANSAEYDSTEDVLEDYPTVAALETKRDDVTATAGVPGTGATAQFAANADDDGLMDDVSAGVFE